MFSSKSLATRRHHRRRLGNWIAAHQAMVTTASWWSRQFTATPSCGSRAGHVLNKWCRFSRSCRFLSRSLSQMTARGQRRRLCNSIELSRLWMAKPHMSQGGRRHG